MADKKASKIILERVYNVPLRRKYLRAPNWKRTKRAVTALQEFVWQHMKPTELKIGKYANLELWKHGIKNPPHHIKVNCRKNEEGIVYVELVGAPVEKVKRKTAKKAQEVKHEAIEVKTEPEALEAKSGLAEQKSEEVKQKKARRKKQAEEAEFEIDVKEALGGEEKKEEAPKVEEAKPKPAKQPKEAKAKE
ncbi:MAG TPA: hypothetical protein VFF28_04105 [Candidatus Nanoarchaeia archaeon]|nr:hypothetical protein [Candidatus Nanoarchaeia archaeon]